MKGEAMQNIEKKESTSIPCRRRTWIGFGAIAVLAVSVALWYRAQHNGKPKPHSNAPMSSMSNMGQTPAPANTASTDSTPSGNTEVQVDLGPDDLKKAQLHTVHVEMRETDSTLRVPGIVNPNEYREVHVTPLVGGVIKQVPVVLGDHVRRGQTLAVIFSSELATAESEYLVVLAELEAEHKKLERTQKLLKLGAASQQEEEEVAASHAGHEAHVREAQEKLKLLGASDRQIAGLKQAEQIDPYLTVPAPINGIVLTRLANLGLVTNPAQELFTVADLSNVWVMASINEKDFATVRVGATARVTAPAYPGRIWKGRVVYIQPQVDPNTRTAQARIEVPNPGESLRFDMYMDVAFTSESGKGLAIPESAVQAIGEKQYVFLPVKDSEGSFVVRQVQLGPASNGYYPVLSGLKLNDEVVKEGSFILKAEAVRQHPEL
ncbi:MAG: efflux RND transporter periplasmic adaptor subunit [Acidobacteriota bacterium]|nr:efflux RND transporter periplasmic adaptor subunit [Acidobacteriota bacterium]